jgi:DsbC/DsbD-like thiol-disulfide interchange protein
MLLTFALCRELARDVDRGHLGCVLCPKKPDRDSTAFSPRRLAPVCLLNQPDRASASEIVEMVVDIRIASAHFIHAQDEAGAPFVPLAASASLPQGLEPVGDWQFPTPEKGRGTALVYRDSVLLRRSLRVRPSAAPQTLTVACEVEYQVCTDELCWPKGKLELSAPILIQSHAR